MTARDDVVTRIRSSLQSGDAQPPPVVRAYNTEAAHAPGSAALVDVFEDRLIDYRATVTRTTQAGIAEAVRAALTQRSLTGRIVVPPGCDRTWYTATDAHVDDGTTTSAELDAADAVLTACAIAIAETGTIVLDASPDQGRRAISLVPDLHICVVRVDQIVDDVPQALRLLDPTRPLTFISGGSATSDIELQRVEGVHGPRTLVVLIVGS